MPNLAQGEEVGPSCIQREGSPLGALVCGAGRLFSLQERQKASVSMVYSLEVVTNLQEEHLLLALLFPFPFFLFFFLFLIPEWLEAF